MQFFIELQSKWTKKKNIRVLTNDKILTIIFFLIVEELRKHSLYRSPHKRRLSQVSLATQPSCNESKTRFDGQQFHRLAIDWSFYMNVTTFFYRLRLFSNILIFHVRLFSRRKEIINFKWFWFGQFTCMNALLATLFSLSNLQSITYQWFLSLLVRWIIHNFCFWCHRKWLCIGGKIKFRMRTFDFRWIRLEMKVFHVLFVLLSSVVTVVEAPS